MKRVHTLTAQAIVAVALLMGVAQGATAPLRQTVNIPFAFKVRGVALPAGQYDVRSSALGQVTLLTNRATGRTVQLMRNVPGAPSELQSFVFTRSADSYQLSSLQ